MNRFRGSCLTSLSTEMMLDQLVLLAAVTMVGLLEQGNYHMIVDGQSNQYVSFYFHMLRETDCTV